MTRGAGGVWVARYPDGSSIVPFGSEVEALRHAVSAHMEVEWVPYGEDAQSYKAPPKTSRPPVYRGPGEESG